jgi:hypothetical protein
MAGNYAYIEDGFFSDPDYQTPAEKLVGLYLFIYGDMSGVTSWDQRLMAAKTGASDKTIRRIKARLSARNKILISDSGDYVWLAAGIFYRLNKGQYSERQLKAVVDKLRFWHSKRCFDHVKADKFWTAIGHDRDTTGTATGQPSGTFLFRVVELYARKYDIKIPIPSLLSYSITEKRKTTHIECGNVDKLSTAGKRLWIRMQLSETLRAEIDKSSDPTWIDDAIQDFSFNRVDLVIDTLIYKPDQLKGRSLPTAVRAICKSQKK